MRVKLLALTLLTVLVVPSTAVAAVPPGPSGAAFYRPATPLPKGSHGTAIWARPYAGTAAIAGATNTAFVYKQVGIDGTRRVATSAFVSVPRGTPPAGGWPVVAWAHGTTGLGDHCAPTRDDNEDDAAKHGPLLARWVEAGYAVVRTDYEGLGTPGRHPYLIGLSEGRAVLDSVRAARQVAPSLSRRVVVAGHSQGGHAALWAASLAPTYAPGLDLRGTLAMAPPSQLVDLLDLMRGLAGPGGLSSSLALFLRGVESARPKLDVEKLLTPGARRVWPQTLSKCKPELALPDSFGAVSSDQVLRKSADLTVVQRVLRRNDPRRLDIDGPILIVQGASDFTVLSSYTARLSRQLTRRGADVDYRSYAGATHATIPVASADDTTAFLAAAFGS